jgi:hypothetical protein
MYANFNNISDISWRSVLLVEETGVRGKITNPQCHFKNTLALYHVYFRTIAKKYTKKRQRSAITEEEADSTKEVKKRVREFLKPKDD